MEWLLTALFAMFVLLALLIKPLYEKLYDSGMITFQGTYDPRLTAYLIRFDDEATLRADWEEYRDRGYTCHHFDKPDLWKTELRSRQERTIRFLSITTFVVYVIVMVLFTWQCLSYGFFVSSLHDGAKFLAPFSLVAILYWRHRRSFCDGSLQGYLNGYMDALEHAALTNSAMDTATQIVGPERGGRVL